MSKKILIIWQAPALKKQVFPYDTTMLYDWLNEIWVSKEKAISICEFEAMTNKKPKISKSGWHLAPWKKEMTNYYELVLKEKIKKADIILLLWKCPIKFFWFEEFFLKENKAWKKFFTLIHPSKRNILLYRNNKEKILWILEEIFNY